MKNKAKKWLCVFLALFMGLSVIVPSVTEAHAAVNLEKEVAPPSSARAPEEVVKLGLTELEMEALLSAKPSGIMLRDGVAYDKNGALLTDGQKLERGKLSWAVKALKKAWKWVPSSVKRALGGTAAYGKLLGYIDHFTGSVEDALQKGLRTLGVGRTAAWWITKILTAVAF